MQLEIVTHAKANRARCPYLNNPTQQGHAVRRIRLHHNPSLPHPMSFDNQSDTYRMRPDVADDVLRLNL